MISAFRIFVFRTDLLLLGNRGEIVRGIVTERIVTERTVTERVVSERAVCDLCKELFLPELSGNDMAVYAIVIRKWCLSADWFT